MEGKTGLFAALVAFFILIALASKPMGFTGFFIMASGENASLTLWDANDEQGGSLYVYSASSYLGSIPGGTSLPSFYANYTNLTSGEPISGAGMECNISFNISNVWTVPAMMEFNASTGLYEYNRSFASRGFYAWNATCYGAPQNFDMLSATDNITVSNTPTKIYVPLANKTCYEDMVCAYNFSANCSDDDVSDRNALSYGYEAGTGFQGFGINSGDGNVTISVTDDSGCGNFRVSLTVRDPTGDGALANKTFIVNAVNDRPVLGNVQNSAYQNSTFDYDVNATDEENVTGPFSFNMTFASCYRPFNNEHGNVTNCSDLLTINQTTGMINKSAAFANADVGNYTLNVTVTDSGDNTTAKNIPPYTWLSNKTDWLVFNFTVLDINDRPTISTVPEQFWTQGDNAGLTINASDIDNGTLVFTATTLYRNLSIYQNASLFPLSSNQTAHFDNGTSMGNATFSFLPMLNSQVGNYTVNVTVTDGRDNGTYSVLVNFTVTNMNDGPSINFTCLNYSVQELPFVCDVAYNTTDPDSFAPYVPYTDSVNGTLYYDINFTYCNKTFNATDTNCTIFAINQTTGLINYTSPLRKDSGNYTINVTATDGGGLSDSFVYNFTVIPNYAPVISIVPAQATTQGQAFYLMINATDADNATDTLTFRAETYYQNGTQAGDKFPIVTDAAIWSWPDGPMAGVMNYTGMNNSQVGNYTISVTVNDTWSREDFISFNITVINLNDEPVLNFSCMNYTYEHAPLNATSYSCNVAQNTTDNDRQTPYGDNLTYNMMFVSGAHLFSINSTTGEINFTALNDTWANNTLNYTYVINITVSDSSNATDWEIFNITIFAVNDPPVIALSNTSVYANNMYFDNVSLDTTDEENNTPFIYNMTIINCTKDNVTDTNCSVFAINSTTGVMTFYALEKDTGNYTINVTARDTNNNVTPYNATGWNVAAFRIIAINHAPSVNIAGVIPGSTFSENDSVIFAISLADIDGDALYCTWFRGDTEIVNVNDCRDDGSWTYTPDFDESGSWNMRLEATDSVTTSHDDWDVTINNLNRAPELSNAVQNQSWNMNTANRNIILSSNFMDLDNENNATNDDDNLTITYTAPEHITVMIDDQLNNATIQPANWSGRAVVTLTPQTDWYGVEYIIFTVNDSHLAAVSNNVTLNVSYTEAQTQLVVQQTSGGGGGSSTTSTKVASLGISVSRMESLMPYNRTSALVTLKNTGQVALSGINIRAEVNDTNELVPSLSNSYISSLAVNQSVTTTLSIVSYALSRDSYEITVTGAVSDPKFNQTAIIYIKPIFNETKVEEKLRLVKDLFEDNPECMDLMELVVQAEREISQNNMNKAGDLTEMALENCRDIIKYSYDTQQKTTPDNGRVPLSEIIIAFLTISLVSVLVYLIVEKRAYWRKVKKP